MTIPATKIMPATVTPTATKPVADFLAAAALPARIKRNRKWLRAAIRDLEQANRPAANEDFVERVNDRVDNLLELPITTIEEVALMAQLVLASDGESLDEPVRTALESIARVLAETVAPGRQ